jgi:serine protease Do
MGVLADIEQGIRHVADAAGRSVVGIGQRWGVGSGVIVGDSTVLTNAHNVRADRTTVTFADGRTAEGRVRGYDIDGDLAVVEVDTGGAPALEWANNASPGLGSAVFALSNPGGRGLRVTVGYVSGVDRSFRGPRGRRIGGSVEHTAPLLPGSSGGPIVDDAGRLLGLNTNRLGEGFYLAIPADQSLRNRVDALSRGESPGKPRLGIAVAPAHVARRLRRAVGLPETEGLLVRDVDEGSPAALAGIAQGDLIVGAAGRGVTRVDDLFEVLDTVRDGELELTVLRGAEERTVRVSFGQAANA